MDGDERESGGGEREVVRQDGGEEECGEGEEDRAEEELVDRVRRGLDAVSEDVVLLACAGGASAGPGESGKGRTSEDVEERGKHREVPSEEARDQQVEHEDVQREQREEVRRGREKHRRAQQARQPDRVHHRGQRGA